MFLKFPENAALKALGPKLEAATRALSAAQQAHDGAGAALISARVAIRHADLLADQGVRLTLKAAEIADGKPGGRIASQLFPSGATPIVKPVGATEVAELRNLEGRLSALKESWPGAAAEATKLAELRTRYEAALENRRGALQAQSNLGAVRAAAREDFLDVYAAISKRSPAGFVALPRSRPPTPCSSDRRSTSGARLPTKPQLWTCRIVRQCALAELRTRYEAALESRRVALHAHSNLGAVRAAAREDFS